MTIQVFWVFMPCRLVKLSMFQRIIVPSSSGKYRLMILKLKALYPFKMSVTIY